jgi:AcrR family transcriptional regulator
MYRLIRNKTDLLERVFSCVIERFMIDFDAAALDALPLEEAIQRIMIAYGILTLSEETIAMNRLVIRECDQFPDVATAFYEAAILRTTGAMAEWLQRQFTRPDTSESFQKCRAGLCQRTWGLKRGEVSDAERLPAEENERTPSEARARAQPGSDRR